MKNSLTNPSIERRLFSGRVEMRTNGAKPPVIFGYAAVYGKPSNPLQSSRGEFVEVIEAGFFERVMNDDVRALFNHNENFVLARSNAGKGTLRLFSDRDGLGYEFTPDERQGYSASLLVSIQRGDIDSSSFSFRVRSDGDSWEKRGGVLTRTLKRGGCAQLIDVSPVTFPAYPDSLSDFRSIGPGSTPSLDYHELRLRHLTARN